MLIFAGSNKQVLQEAFATERMKLSHKAVVDWERRWIMMRMLVLKAQPHVLVFQEMDHMAEAQEQLGRLGYDCALAPDATVVMWEVPAVERDDSSPLRLGRP